jgi:hypothetical protein
MIVSSPYIEASPMAGRVRLCADVTYDDRPGEPETYWFDVPEEYEKDLSVSGNPWLVALLPLAVTLREPFKVEAAVDLQLLANAEEIMGAWRCWYPHLQPIPLCAEVGQQDLTSPPERVASFFSGGVDSFFTVLRHDDPDHLRIRHPVDDLLAVWGFDVPLSKPEEFDQMRTSLRKAADQLGKGFVDVATNLRTTRWREATWADLAHGCALGSVAHALGGRYRVVMIGSSAGYERLYPWGSHPITDPLLSSGDLRVVHDGAAYNRFMKIEYIASNEVVRRALRVCYKHGASANCGNCVKCYRTMLALHTLGKLEAFEVFDHDFSNKSIKRVYLKNHVELANMEIIRRRAQELGKSDVEVAIARSVAVSKRIVRTTPLFDRLRFTRVGRWSERLRRRIMHDVIT